VEEIYLLMEGTSHGVEVIFLVTEVFFL